MRSASSIPVNYVPDDSLVLDARTDCDTVTPGEPFHVLLTLSLRPSRLKNASSYTVTTEPGKSFSSDTGGQSLVPLEPSTQQTMIFLPSDSSSSSSSSSPPQLVRYLGSSIPAGGGTARNIESALAVRTPLVVVEKMTVRLESVLRLDGAGFHVPVHLTTPHHHHQEQQQQQQRQSTTRGGDSKQNPLSSITLFECAASSPHHVWQVKPSEPLTVCFTATIPPRAMPSHAGAAAKIKYTLNTYVSWKAVLDAPGSTDAAAGTSRAAEKQQPKVSTPRSLQMSELHLTLPVVRRGGIAALRGTAAAAAGGGAGGAGLADFFGGAGSALGVAVPGAGAGLSGSAGAATAVPFLSFRERHLRHDFRAKLQLICGSTTAGTAHAVPPPLPSSSSADPPLSHLVPPSTTNAAAAAAAVSSKLALSSPNLGSAPTPSPSWTSGDHSSSSSSPGSGGNGLSSTSGALPVEIPVVVDGEPIGVLLMSCTDIRIGGVWRAAFTPAPAQIAASVSKKKGRSKCCALIEFFFERDELVADDCVRSGAKVPESALYQHDGRSSSGSSSGGNNSYSKRWIVTERRTVLESQLFTLDDINANFFISGSTAASNNLRGAAAPPTLDVAIHPSQVSPSLLTDVVRVVWRLRCIFAIVDVDRAASYVKFPKPQPGEHLLSSSAAPTAGGSSASANANSMAGITPMRDPNKRGSSDSLSDPHYQQRASGSSLVAPSEAYREIAMFGESSIPVTSSELIIPVNMI